MLDISNFVLTDEAVSLVENGTWVGDLKGAPGLELRVCGLNSVESQKAIEKHQALARANNRNEPLNDRQISEVMQKVIAEVVLKDWRGLSSGGKPLKYTKELATEFLTGRKGQKLAMLVIEAAKKLDSRANDFVEAVGKN